MSGSASPTQYYGQMTDPSAMASQANAMEFFVSRMMARMVTIALVRVESVKSPGGLSSIGSVNVRPLVHQVDGKGQVTPHGVVQDLPYFRLQGGSNAVIIDPVAGDLGLAAVCYRDTSTVRRSRQPSPPGSARSYDWADAFYLGGVLNGVPSQYVLFSGNTVHIHAATEVILSAGSQITLQAPIVTTSGEIQAAGAITAGFGTGSSVTVQQHRHPANNTPPTPGT